MRHTQKALVIVNVKFTAFLLLSVLNICLNILWNTNNLECKNYKFKVRFCILMKTQRRRTQWKGVMTCHSCNRSTLNRCFTITFSHSFVIFITSYLTSSMSIMWVVKSEIRLTWHQKILSLDFKLRNHKLGATSWSKKAGTESFQLSLNLIFYLCCQWCELHQVKYCFPSLH